MSKSEKLNEMIFAEEQGLNPSQVRGTGVFRQFVPKSSRGNILDRPPRGSRLLWANKVGHHRGRRPLGFVTPLIFNKRSGLKLANALLPKKAYVIVNGTVAIYCYFRDAKFVYKIKKKVFQFCIKQ